MRTYLLEEAGQLEEAVVRVGACGAALADLAPWGSPPPTLTGPTPVRGSTRRLSRKAEGNGFSLIILGFE